MSLAIQRAMHNRGDPGIGSIIGGALKSLGKVAKVALPGIGGLAGSALTGAGGLISRPNVPRMAAMLAPPQVTPQITPAMVLPGITPVVQRQVAAAVQPEVMQAGVGTGLVKGGTALVKRVLKSPAGRAAVGIGGSMLAYEGVSRLFGGGAAEECPKGYHRNKALVRYEVAIKNGRNVKEPNVVNECVRHRSVNVANVRALNRAHRRQRGFIKTFARVARQMGYGQKRVGKATVCRKCK